MCQCEYAHITQQLGLSQYCQRGLPQYRQRGKLKHSLELLHGLGALLGLGGVEVAEALHEAAVGGGPHVHLVLGQHTLVPVAQPARHNRGAMQRQFRSQSGDERTEIPFFV